MKGQITTQIILEDAHHMCVLQSRESGDTGDLAAIVLSAASYYLFYGKRYPNVVRSTVERFWSDPENNAETL